MDLSLYLVADFPSFQKNTALFFSKIEEAVRGGITCVQLRDLKNDSAVSTEVALRLKDRLSVPLIINTKDLIEVAKRVHAAGVFLEEKLSYTEARAQLGENSNIGLPVESIDEIWRLPLEKINYISLKIFESKKTSKKGSCWGIEGLQKARKFAHVPIVAIGGINANNAKEVMQVLQHGDGIAMAGSLLREDNPCSTAQKILEIYQKTAREQVLF